MDERQELGAVLQSLSAEGRLSRSTARELRNVLGVTSRIEAEIKRDPEAQLGPFAALPSSARRAIVESIVARDKFCLNAGALLQALALPIRHTSSQAGQLLQSTFGRSLYKHLRASLVFADAATHFGLAFASKALYGRWLTVSALATRPRLAAVLARSGLDLDALCACYAKSIPQIGPFRCFWHDKTRNHAVGVIVGIDLISTPAGQVVVETNLIPALRHARSALYGSLDPLPERISAHVASSGFRRMVWVAHTVTPSLVEQLHDSARRHSVDLTIHDYLQPQTTDLHDTLVVRNALHPTAIDRILHDKRASSRALAAYQHEESAYLLPELDTTLTMAGDDLDQPFPNIVCKLPHTDRGYGVFFFKAESAEHARALMHEAVRSAGSGGLRGYLARTTASTTQPIYQRYARSDFAEGRRLHVTRAHLLIAPTGVVYLSAHRVMSTHDVPIRLPLGIVRDPRPFLVNFSTGARYAPVPATEEPAIARAALAVGRALASACTDHFICGP